MFKPTLAIRKLQYLLNKMKTKKYAFNLFFKNAYAPGK